MLMKTRSSLAVLMLLLVAGGAQAQLDVDVQPGSSPYNYQLTLTPQPTYSLTFLDSCIVNQVRAERPEGPIVWEAQVCADVIIPLPEGSSLSVSWDAVDHLGAPLAPGSYWLRFSYKIHKMLGVHHQMVEVEILASDPVLHATNGAMVGAPAILTLDAPLYGGALYLASASLAIDANASAGELQLIPDALFSYALANPNGGDFLNFVGNLDVFGQATNLRVNIPAVPALEGVDIHVQAVTGLQGGQDLPLRFSNVETLTITNVE